MTWSAWINCRRITERQIDIASLVFYPLHLRSSTTWRGFADNANRLVYFSRVARKATSG